jgi:hypothetical protein
MTSSPIALHFSSLKRRRRCFTGFDPGLMFNLCSATSLGIHFMSEGFHENTSRFALRKSTSALSYLGSSVVPIRSVRLSSETIAPLTSLAGSKEQVAHLDDLGTFWSSDRGSARSLSDRMIASVN